MRQQLSRPLLRDGLARTPWERLQHLPRYLKASSMRLDKLRADPARDARLAAELASLEHPYRREAAARAATARRARNSSSSAGCSKSLRVSLRAGADSGPRLGQASHETLADCAAMNVSRFARFRPGQCFPPAHALADDLADAGIARCMGDGCFLLWSRLAVDRGNAEAVGGSIAGWAPFDLGTAATFIANFMLLVLFFPLVYLTALFILGIFGMDKMVDHVAAQMSPSPERRRGGTAGSIWNGIVSLTGIVLLFLVSLPLWLVPPLGPIAVLAILSG